MVACCCERVLYVPEDAFAVVFNAAGFSVHQPLCGCNFATVRAYYPLMTKADAECGHLRADLLEDGSAYAEVSFVIGVARAWRDDYSVWFELSDLFRGYFIVSVNKDFGSKFPDELHQIVDERVVVVYDYYSDGLSPPQACKAFIRALAFCSVSNHSRSGIESATMPAPTCMNA